MNIKKEHWLNFIGIFLVVLGAIRIIQLLFFGVPVHVFWLCNHVIILMGIAILFRSSFWLTAEFTFLFLGQLIWIIALLLFAFFGITVPGNSAYLIYNAQFINLITMFVHFLTLPLAFIAILILNKKEKFAWTGAFLHALILMPFVIYFGSQYNLNCLLDPCLDYFPNSNLYTIIILPAYFLLFVIPLNYLITWIIRKRKR